MSETNEKILDSCLEEVLGGCQPPDLAPQILRAYERIVEEGHGAVSAAAPEIVVRPPNPLASAVHPPVPWIGFAVAAGVLAAGISLGLLALRWGAPAGRVQTGVVQDAGVAGNEVQTAAGPGPAAAGIPPQEREIIQQTEQPDFDPPDFGNSPLDSIVETPPATPPAVAIPLDWEQIVSALDERLRRGWRTAGLDPAAPLPDALWLDRVFQQLIGRPPTASERTAFVADSSGARRTRVIEQLCGPQFNAEFARHWGARWAGVLVDSSNAAAARHRPPLQSYLESSLASDRNMAEITEALLTAAGDSSAAEGATNYLLAHVDRRSIRAAGHAARIFLGQRLDCAQCHDHPVDTAIGQRTFWEWNAYFSQLAVERPAAGPSLVDRVAAGRGRGGAVFFETPSGEMKAAYPAFPGQATGGLSIPVGAERRRELAATLVASGPYRAAVANRVWSMLLGTGLVLPLDDISHRETTFHADVLDLISEQFAAHRFELRALVSWIAASEAFALQGSAASVPSGSVFAGYTPRTQRRPLSKLLAGMLSGSEPQAAASTTARLAPVGGPPGAAAGLIPSDAETGEARRLPARGPRRPPRLVAQILESELEPDDKLTHLFEAVLHRPPRNAERRPILRWLAAADPALAEESWLDLWWTILHSDERP